jgi:UDPglucose 6-dehydrogenase
VEAVARGIGSHLNGGYKVIVNKSTVPIGSGDWVRMLVLDGIAERQKSEAQPVLAGGGVAEEITPNSLTGGYDFDVVSNPEFLREGSAVFDTFNPDRIVLGSNNPKAIEVMQELYTPIVERQFAENKAEAPVPVVVTDLSSAEMIKYAANAFLATKISFINEVANVCDRVGADVMQVAKGIGLDSRIGSKFLQAGLGWGGSCFPKDVSALIHTADDYGYEAQLMKAAVSVNERQRLIVVEKLQQVLKILKGKTIGLLGLTFKPDTDDLRDAPALNVIENLTRLGAKVKAYDPIISQTGMRHGISDVLVETDPERLADACDALVLVTEWQQFQTLDYVTMAKLMHTPILIDGRNFLDQAVLEDAGFRYVGIGR